MPSKVTVYTWQCACDVVQYLSADAQSESDHAQSAVEDAQSVMDCAQWAWRCLPLDCGLSQNGDLPDLSTALSDNLARQIYWTSNQWEISNKNAIVRNVAITLMVSFFGSVGSVERCITRLPRRTDGL